MKKFDDDDEDGEVSGDQIEDDMADLEERDEPELKKVSNELRVLNTFYNHSTSRVFLIPFVPKSYIRNTSPLWSSA